MFISFEDQQFSLSLQSGAVCYILNWCVLLVMCACAYISIHTLVVYSVVYLCVCVRRIYVLIHKMHVHTIHAKSIRLL